MANDHLAVMKALDWSRTKPDSRLLLAHACDAVAEALLEEQIKIGHAELLCRPPCTRSGGHSVEDHREELFRRADQGTPAGVDSGTFRLHALTPRNAGAAFTTQARMPICSRQALGRLAARTRSAGTGKPSS
ncbi:hypothetical protein L1887_47355 [Cichorium endivia]|nr:hypothetical protein L1887_47355 [Cichorium endivia]